MKAKFIGKSSLGFERGRTYTITTSVSTLDREKPSNTGRHVIWVDEVAGNLSCPYTNIEKFLENWEVIEV